MSALDTTIVILSLPSISEELASPLYLTIWIIIIYILVISVLTTQLGNLGDIYGRGKMYNLGFAVFTAASALCGFSNTIYFLLFSRALQALGASLMQANSGAIIAENFEVRERGKAFGYTTLGWNIGATLGILLGGVITTFLGWRYIFFINVPIGIFSLLLGIKYLKSPASKMRKGIDYVGALSLFASLFLISFSASDITAFGLTGYNLTLLLLGILFLPVFVFAEKSSSNPVIDLTVFRERMLSFSLIASFFQSIGYLSLSFIIILYLQGVKGLNPLDASLLLMPAYIVSSVLSPFSGRLTDKYGARIMATLGILLMALTVSILYFILNLYTPLLYIAFTFVIGSIGAAFFYPANNSAIMSSGKIAYYGSISGLMRTLGNIGTLGSYVISISIASITIPREVAFEVFLGVTSLGSISYQFVFGIKSALILSFILLIIAGFFSAIRGRELSRIRKGH